MNQMVHTHSTRCFCVPSIHPFIIHPFIVVNKITHGFWLVLLIIINMIPQMLWFVDREDRDSGKLPSGWKSSSQHTVLCFQRQAVAVLIVLVVNDVVVVVLLLLLLYL